MPAIKVSDLTKRYNSFTAVDRISLEVPEGTIFGFLGPNGAGKTTTISMLCTLLKPTSGEASVNGYDSIREPSRVRESIGIVFQETTLDKDLTAFENLYYHSILYNVQRHRRKDLVRKALRFVGLYERKDEPVKKFSGGMKRRLEVARAVVHQPRILFLDEPTLGLDPQSRTSLWEFITRLPSEEGVTVFMTTHYMDEAEVCHNIAIIDNGRIIAKGSPDELKKGIGGDLIYIKVTDEEEAVRLIRDRLSLNPVRKGEELSIPVTGGDACIPELIRTVGDLAISVRIQRPTLNDVFLNLTGKAIREEEQDSSDTIKDSIREYRRRFDRR
jgi:ABC-2 type transport system ATP-binding protein